MAEIALAKFYLTPDRLCLRGAPPLQIIREGEQMPCVQDIHAALLAFAGACLNHDMTQTAADTLAYLLQDAGVNATVRDEAAEVFDELERRICPRVILDARAFANGMDLPTMLEYLLDDIKPETT